MTLCMCHIDETALFSEHKDDGLHMCILELLEFKPFRITDECMPLEHS